MPIIFTHCLFAYSGSDGSDGSDGAPGTEGPPGEQGPAGEKGEQGIMIVKNANIVITRMINVTKS